jgi:hypothetical protein
MSHGLCQCGDCLAQKSNDIDRDALLHKAVEAIREVETTIGSGWARDRLRAVIAEADRLGIGNDIK